MTGATLRLYRIAQEHHLPRLEGQGASFRDGGRWNSPGHPVLYFGGSPSVAALEMGHYLVSPRHVPKGYALGVFEVPNSVVELGMDDMPDDWRRFPYPRTTQRLGDAWLARGQELVLRVPSCAVPAGLEWIAVVNPLHPKSQAIKLLDIVAPIYNERLFTGI